MPLLKVENLKTIYRTREVDIAALQNISFSLERGKTLGIVGESGCGKSTLMKSIIGVLPENAHIAEGNIKFKTKELTRLNDDQFRRIRWKEISMITQSAMNALDPVYTVGYQIMEAIKAHMKVDKKTARRMVREIFSLVGIDPNRSSEYPHQFSGGMRQRVIIAMSLVLKPSLVIADEPTTSLDVIVQDQIFKNIKKMQEMVGFSMLLVTHDIALIIENCDDIAVMYGGRIMEVGPMGDVIHDTFHPYTLGLKNSFPNILDRTAELLSIPGVPPRLLGTLKGCPFYGRCPFASEVCQKQTPVLRAIDGTHKAACHHLDNIDKMRELAVQPDTWLNMEKTINVKTL